MVIQFFKSFKNIQLFQNNPSYSQKLVIFGNGAPNWQTVITPYNSPVKSIFKAGILRMRQNGAIENLLNKWEGPVLPNYYGVDKETLSPGQTIMVYFLLCSGFGCTLTILMLEKLWHSRKTWNQKRISIRRRRKLLKIDIV